MQRKMLVHVESRGHTDERSRKVTTVCGKNIRRGRGVRRFRSEVFGLMADRIANRCDRCAKIEED